MNTLKMDKKIQILNGLVEGCSIRSIERMTSTHRDTIMRLLVKTGNQCEGVMDKFIKNFHCKRIEVDELWTFIAKKEALLNEAEKQAGEWGSQYIFVALDPVTKVIPSFTVGKRNYETTLLFLAKLYEKVSGNGRIQITSDGWHCYINAVDEIFGSAVDFAQLIKVYGKDEPEFGRYSPPKILETVSKIINGNPDPKNICTSFIERQNLTMRMQIRRLITRLTNAFSKKLENLKAALNLHFAHYNFIRVHGSLRITPCMAAGISDHIWDWEEIVG